MDPKNYTVHEDGSKVPTWEYISECLQKLRDGDQEFLDSLIPMAKNPETGNWERVDRTS